MALSGIFITFEGIEGCGKSTQIRRLADHLHARGCKVVLTREPGGTVIGERIRSVLLDASHSAMAPVTELLLYTAARHQHVAEVIRPALEQGRIVLCDRYADATTAYQGAARRIDPEAIRQLHRIATENLDPDLTVLLDCPADEGLNRARERNAKSREASKHDRFEREELAFHERVRDGYLAIAAGHPQRVAVVPSHGTVDEVHARILAVIAERLPHLA